MLLHIMKLFSLLHGGLARASEWYRQILYDCTGSGAHYINAIG